MISKELRFHGHGSLNFLYKNGETKRSKHMALKSISNPRRKKPRFAVVVSKKVHKSAVKRNFIRRRIYEIWRKDIMPKLKIKNLDAAVIVYSPELIRLANSELGMEIEKLFAEFLLLDE